MANYQLYDATKNKLSLPIVFTPKYQKAYRDFLSDYDPKIGFLIAKIKRDYYIYLGGFQYKLYLYDQHQRSVGFGVKAQDGISQKSTISIATDSIRITGLSKDYILMSDQLGNFLRSHPNHNFSRSLRQLDAPLSSKVEDSAFIPHPLWKELLNLNEEKLHFASHFLIQWPYASFTSKGNVSGGFEYIFQVAAPDEVIACNEKRFDDFRNAHDILEEDKQTDDSPEALREAYLNKLKPGSIVEIPLNRPPDRNGKQPMLYGTVVRLELPGVTHEENGEARKLSEEFYKQAEYFARPWCMVLSFKDDNTVSVKDISDTGSYIGERLSTDYQNYKAALSVMTRRNCQNCWTAAEQVLIQHKCTPPATDIQPVYTATQLNDNQKQAIRMALNAPDFLLVQGPPGSGKTTIITEMVRNFVLRGQRVLVCSKGNLAVDNVLEKWVAENKDRPDGHLCIRLGDRFKLAFLEKYTPAQVTARLQEKAYTKSKQERDRLIARIEERIRAVEENRATVSKAIALCIAACDLTQTLYALCAAYQTAIRRYRQKSGVLHQKLDAAKLAYSAAYQKVMMSCYDLLCSDQMPNSQQISHFDYYCREINKQLAFIPAEFKPGFFARLLAGKEADAWKPLEAQLQQHASAFFRLGIRGKDLQPNPLANVRGLQLPTYEKAPSPLQVKNVVTSFQAAFHNFSRQESLRLDRIQAVLNDWLIELGSGVSSALEKHTVLDSIPVIGSTCMGIMSDNDFKNLTYDVVIVDEAGQIPIYDLMVPIIKAKKVILIGDHLQLPPMDENDFARYFAARKTGAKSGEAFQSCKEETAQWFNISLFEKLFGAKTLQDASIMLDTQYRMHPQICAFISQNFYDGKYKSGVTAQARNLKIADFHKPIYFYDTCNLPAHQRQETNHNPGYSNATEAELMSNILVKLILAIRDGNYSGAKLVQQDKDGNITGYDIGVISGYKKQVKLIHSRTLEKLCRYMSAQEAAMHMERFMISSVDSFQGRDNQIILFSMTRSNPEGKIGFLKDVRRLNVAMTRAKSLLIMVGDSATLTSCNAMCAHDSTKSVAQIYKNLVDYCASEDRGYYYPLKGGENDGLE